LTAADAKGRGGGGGSSVLFLCVLCLHVGLAESFSYDFDGNLSQDVGFDYTWDGENRLKTATPRNPDNGDEKVAFVYDYMGRRVEKTYKIYSGGWQVQSGYPVRFVYDGWNPVLVLNGSNETVRKYTWGLDLSQSIHGAGGIGGLLAAVETKGTITPNDDEHYWFLYDANGNVGQVLDATDTNNITIGAYYEYDPYGNLINNGGLYKATRSASAPSGSTTKPACAITATATTPHDSDGG